MDKTIKKIYIIELLILLLVVLIFIINNEQNKSIFTIISFGIMLFATLVIYGRRKDNNFLKDSAFRLVIAILLAYFIIISMLGLVIGFTKTLFSLNINLWFDGLLPTLAITIVTEYLRYTLIINNYTNKKAIYLITVLMILFNIAINSNIFTLTDAHKIFIFICTVVFPAIAQELLGSYIVYNYGFLPAITFKLIINLYIYVMPIITNLGNYLHSAFGVLIPFTIYIILSRNIKNNIDIKKNKKNVNKISRDFITIPIMLMLIIIIILVSGIAKYQMIAVASDSMTPVFSRGDAVILKKIDAEDVKIGDVLVFKKDDLVITHRVTKIKEENSKLYFYTKGDANISIDAETVKESNVIGVVKCVAKYIGYPTVWLNDLLWRWNFKWHYID